MKNRKKPNFPWTRDHDRRLCRTWDEYSIEGHAERIGCHVDTVRRKARELKLPPKDPVKRALAAGEQPARTTGITLPRVAFLERVNP